ELLVEARRLRTRVELDKVVNALLRSRVADLARGEAYDEQIEALLNGTTDPYRAGETLLTDS
ncbi:MAG TPA: hypothetical protein VNF05_06285, partial [Acidimicrobiales bacterium]|nr:hypothetical protein [Acidimicrobiales bacterium]